MTLKFAKVFAVSAALACAAPAFAEEAYVSEVSPDMAVSQELSVGDELGAEDLMTARRPGRPGRPGWGRPGRPGRPGWGRPGNPGWGRAVTCFARNQRGQTFQAWGRGNWQQIQRAAVNECARRSWGGFRGCRALGCR